MNMNVIFGVALCMILQYISAENITSRAVGDACLEHGSFIACTPDCRGRRSCWLGKEIVTDCMAQTGRPYCNSKTGECSSIISGDCSTSADTVFKCPSVNKTFPYALDCRKFWHCPSIPPAKAYECMNLIYDPKTRVCASGIPCYTFSPVTGLCRDRKNVFVAHPLNRGIYALCTGDFPQLDECPADLIFDTQKARCVHDCKQIGNFPDPNSDNCYFSCTRVTTYWKSEFNCCEAPLVFNKTLSTCFAF